MKKIEFNRDCVARLDEPLSVGDVIEVTNMYGIKSTLMVCIDEDNSTSCSGCVFNTGGSVCEAMVCASFVKDGLGVSPCNALLLNDGKEYKFKHCLYYKNMDAMLEDL